MENEQEFDFDLPEPTPITPANPRVHVSGSVCISCEA